VESGRQLVAEIFVRDIRRSKAFYRELRFRLIREEPDFAVLTWEEHQLFLDERKELPPLPEFPQGNLRIMVPNVDDYWTLANAMGARVIAQIADRGYGLRDFTIVDPDGFGLRFATPLPDAKVG
jgi:catechol 2,3-dioxygenase-like lactoylglutathione lyase family enzyme